MSVFDLIIIVILLALTLRGVWTGMVSQIVSVGSLIVCWIVASRFAFVIAPSIPAEAPWNKVGAMIVLFAVTMIAIRFVHGVLEKKLKDWGLAGLNKTLGGGLGFLKGLLVCMLLTFFGVTLSVTTRQMVFESKTGHHLADLISKTGTVIPQDSCDLLRAQIDLFNAKRDGIEGPQEATEDDYLKQMLAATQETEKNSPSGSEFGDYLSRSSAVMGAVQDLRQNVQNDWNKEKTDAVSLFDAIGKRIGKWWNGDSATANLADTQATVKAIIPESIHESSPAIVSEIPHRVAAADREETLFRTTQNAPAQPFTPPSAKKLAELFSHDNTAHDTTQDDTLVDDAMEIPRSPSSFRLRRAVSDRSSERLLHSTQSGRSSAPATVFSNQ